MTYSSGHMPIRSPSSILDPFFEERSWKPFKFQKQVWKQYFDGNSGLLHAPTGLGKTLAVWLAPLTDSVRRSDFDGCQVLWITPLRALAQDSVKALREPVLALGLKAEIAMRTGDSSSYQKAKLKKRLPYALVTTPESLSLHLTHENFRENLRSLRMVVVDEWHEMVGTKRGVQTELCLARLRQWFPDLRIWGLSATLGNTEQAKEVLLGDSADEGVVISGLAAKKMKIETLLPESMERFPWSGHIGTLLAKKVVALLEAEPTSLLFTNTRSQTEIWFQEILQLRPEWEGELAMHHGSLDREERTLVEERLRNGAIRCVVCTSSLDLGVDFSPVAQVIQVGSPKGVARLMQRAGRSGHQPGAVSKLFCVPTNALEIVEFAAARESMRARKIEAKLPIEKPLDLLVQHVITVCIGEPMTPAQLYAEVRSSYAFRNLNSQEWEWVLEFLIRGGKALSAYPNYKKLQVVEGKLSVLDKKLIQLHRFNIGTITSHRNVNLVSQAGRRYGSVEESFISRIKPGQPFIFGGQRLELVRLKQSRATVKKSSKRARGNIPTWAGSRMPLSNELASAVAKLLTQEKQPGREMKSLAPILKVQSEWSIIPSDQYLLFESVKQRRENHLFVFTFAGRLANEGLGSLVAWRITQMRDASIQVTMNDYGFSLTSEDELPFEEAEWRELFSSDYLMENLLACMNTAELARRQFQGIARISGLVLQNLPRGKSAPTKDLMASSRLLYEVFERYDPDNLLMLQARREILDSQLDFVRLRTTMESILSRRYIFKQCERLTPMAFPLWADRLQAHYHGDDAATRLEKMIASLEMAAS